jgi:hypothetical protein
MIGSTFLSYALHYVILRTLYTAARGLGVNPWFMLACAVVGLVLLRAGFRHGGERSSWRNSPRKAYRIELARQAARRDAAAQGRRPKRWWRW